MVYYHLGNVIRELRNRLSMTQEELAAGICSVSSVSKIEKGTQMPSAHVAEALFERLQDAAIFFTGFCNEQEQMELQDWEGLVNCAKNHRDAGSIFEEQLYRYVCFLEKMQKKTGRNQNQEAAGIFYELMEILIISMPLTELYHESAVRKAYTWLELYLMNHIAVQFYYMDSVESADRILKQILHYLEVKGYGIVGEASERLYPVICANLSALKVAAGLAHQAHAICIKGIRAALRSGLIYPLAALYKNLSTIQLALHETAEAQKSYSYARMLQELADEYPPETFSVHQEMLEAAMLTCYI